MTANVEDSLEVDFGDTFPGWSSIVAVVCCAVSDFGSVLCSDISYVLRTNKRATIYTVMQLDYGTWEEE